MEIRVRRENVSQVQIRWEGLEMKQVGIVRVEDYAIMKRDYVNVSEDFMAVVVNIIGF